MTTATHQNPHEVCLIEKQCFTERHWNMYSFTSSSHSSLISSNCKMENNEATVMLSIKHVNTHPVKGVLIFGSSSITMQLWGWMYFRQKKPCDFNVAMAEGFEALRRSIVEVRTDTHPSLLTRLLVPSAAQVSQQALKVWNCPQKLDRHRVQHTYRGRLSFPLWLQGGSGVFSHSQVEVLWWAIVLPLASGGQGPSEAALPVSTLF